MESKPKRFADAFISAYFCLNSIGPINILESIMCMSACFHGQAVSIVCCVSTASTLSANMSETPIFPEFSVRG